MSLSIYRAGDTVTTVDQREWVAIMHLRQKCHDSTVCPICISDDFLFHEGQKLGFRRAIRETPVRH